MGRVGGCGEWDGMGERKLMRVQECGEKSRIETRLDFGGLLRGYFRHYVRQNGHLLIRSNPAKQKIELSGKNRGSETRSAVFPLIYFGPPLLPLIS